MAKARCGHHQEAVPPAAAPRGSPQRSTLQHPAPSPGGTDPSLTTNTKRVCGKLSQAAKARGAGRRPTADSSSQPRISCSSRSCAAVSEGSAELLAPRRRSTVSARRTARHGGYKTARAFPDFLFFCMPWAAPFGKAGGHPCCRMATRALPEGPAPHQLGCAGTDREILQRCICWKEEENGDEEWAALPALHWDVPAHLSDLPVQLQCVSSIGPTILSSKCIDLHYLVPKKKLPFLQSNLNFEVQN